MFLQTQKTCACLQWFDYNLCPRAEMCLRLDDCFFDHSHYPPSSFTAWPRWQTATENVFKHSAFSPLFVDVLVAFLYLHSVFKPTLKTFEWIMVKRRRDVEEPC